ncbi:hypothetical protein AK830_g706 [Neonectria ditissima]|uniref:Sugar phosphate transporter domain-containing protein n=1 Tax=Neonectria ditissima TaxID=78410 RepID=A0A0P7BW89_9HYPO|nr:hypothetical protein AK830_g706 [Neonectria ditissima]
MKLWGHLEEGRFPAAPGPSAMGSSRESRLSTHLLLVCVTNPSLYCPSILSQIVYPGVVNWMLLSTFSVLSNKWLLDTANFRYPIILTTSHLLLATIATQTLACTTSVLDSRHNVPLTGRLIVRALIPMSILYSGYLIFSNMAYLYLSVAFIQILQALGPVAILLVSWAWGVVAPSTVSFLNILLIIFGVALASTGETKFSGIGFFTWLAGTGCEAIRLVLSQVTLSPDGHQLDPIVIIYYVAPVCTVISIFFASIYEGDTFQWDDITKAGGYSILLLNASLAFLASTAGVVLTNKTSGLTMSLSGMLKSILLVAVSVLIWGTSFSFAHGFGYSITLIGLLVHSVGSDELLNNQYVAAALGTGPFKGQTLHLGKWVVPSGKKLFIVLLAAMMMIFSCFLWFLSETTNRNDPGKPETGKSAALGMLDSEQ